MLLARGLYKGSLLPLSKFYRGFSYPEKEPGAEVVGGEEGEKGGVPYNTDPFTRQPPENLQKSIKI